jgi:NAD dependent epimerase/dehydratase family enzyme
LFGWLERKAFLGDVIRDYGLLDGRRMAVSRYRTSVLLCRRGGQLRLVFRTVGTALGGALGAGVSYVPVDATPEALAKLEQVVDDARKEASVSWQAG